MLTPQTKTENALAWLAAFLIAVLLAFLGSLAKQLPGNDPLNWRMVTLDVITVVISLTPVVAAGLGLPRLGAENRAALIDSIGKEKATTILEQAAIGEKPNAYSGVDYAALADEILARRKQDELLQSIRTKDSGSS